MSTSPGQRGGASALEHLVSTMPYRGAKVIGSLSLGSFNDNFSEGFIAEDKAEGFKLLLGKLEEAI